MEDSKRSTSSMELRKRAGLSRVQVAFVLGVAEGTVAKWEQGTQEPRLPPWKMKMWTDLYQCTIEELAEAFPPPLDDDLNERIKTIYDRMHV
jgi:transcriptional regulator with XRE-family HTH domain